jgi:thiamine biosynthesis lipoprotein
MGRVAYLWLVAAGWAAIARAEPTLVRFERSGIEMAVPIRLVFYVGDEESANGAASAVFRRMAQLNAIMSDYDRKSELRRLCDTAGEGMPVRVSDELWAVLSHAQVLLQQSDGAFDVTIGPVVRLWRRARKLKMLPDPARIHAALELVGSKQMVLDPRQQTVLLKKKGMRLDLGGIAKGYIVDQGLAVLRRAGITRAMIYAGGDIGLGDPPPGKSGWVVGIGQPDADARPIVYLSLSRCSVATSGDTWQYAVIDEKRYSHILDPRTGMALEDHSCVAIVAPNGMMADALATAVSVLGPEKGLMLIERQPATAGQILRKPGEKLQVYRSSRWKNLPVAMPPTAPTVPTAQGRTLSP